jgi:hypothetical protein
MTLPHLNGKTGMALSIGSLVSVLGMCAAVVQDRIRISEQLTELRVAGEERGRSNKGLIDAHEARIGSLETPGGRTVPALETLRRLDALEQSVRDLQRELGGLQRSAARGERLGED